MQYKTRDLVTALRIAKLAKAVAEHEGRLKAKPKRTLGDLRTLSRIQAARIALGLEQQ